MPDLPAPALPAFRPVLCRAAHVALDSGATIKPLTCLALLRLALTWINSATEFPGEGKGLEGDKEPLERERKEGGVDEVVVESMRLVRRLTTGDAHLLPTYVLLDEVGLLNGLRNLLGYPASTIPNTSLKVTALMSLFQVGYEPLQMLLHMHSRAPTSTRSFSEQKVRLIFLAQISPCFFRLVESPSTQMLRFSVFIKPGIVDGAVQLSRHAVREDCRAEASLRQPFRSECWSESLDSWQTVIAGCCSRFLTSQTDSTYRPYIQTIPWTPTFNTLKPQILNLSSYFVCRLSSWATPSPPTSRCCRSYTTSTSGAIKSCTTSRERTAKFGAPHLPRCERPHSHCRGSWGSRSKVPRWVSGWLWLWLGPWSKLPNPKGLRDCWGFRRKSGWFGKRQRRFRGVLFV